MMSLRGAKRRGNLFVCNAMQFKRLPRRFAPRKDKGFTLIEVLIALAILAIALTAIIYSVASSVRNTAHLQDKLAAHWVAMNILSSSQVGLIQVPTETSQTQTGTATMLNQKWSWTLGIDQPTIAKGALFARVYVRVNQFQTKNTVAYLRGFDQLVPSLNVTLTPEKTGGGGQ